MDVPPLPELRLMDWTEQMQIDLQDPDLIIRQLRAMLTRSSQGHQRTLGERNRYRAALEEIRDSGYRDGDKLREIATDAFKLKESKA